MRQHERRERFDINAALRTVSGPVAAFDLEETELEVLKIAGKGNGDRAFDLRGGKGIELVARAEEELARKYTEENIERVLQKAWNRQMLANQRNGNVLKGNSVTEILSSYRGSSLKASTFKELDELYFKSDDTYGIFRQLAGRIFEDVAFGLLSASNQEEEIILSEENAYELANVLYSDGERIRNTFGHRGIRTRKANVPDGLGVSKRGGHLLVDSSFEYSLHKDVDWHDKYRRFSGMVRRYPDIFSNNPNLIIVIPEDYQVPSDISERDDVEVLPAPFAKSEFIGQMKTFISEEGYSRVVA